MCKYFFNNFRSNLVGILSLSFVLIFISASAQEKDFELWTSIGVSKKLSKKFSVALKEDVRFYNNATSLKSNYTQLSASYNIKKFVSIGLAYRFANKKEYDFSTTHQHLFLSDLKLKQNYKRFDFAYRLRYQRKYSNINTEENGTIPATYLRHRWTVKYNIRKTRFQPYASFELFQDMDYPERYYQKKHRFTLACTYKSKNKNETTVFFTLQREMNQINPLQSGILGVKYNFSL